MRQPICGWLLAAVVASTAPTAQASTPEPARQQPSGTPCAPTGNPRPSADITCCHAPDFKSMRGAPSLPTPSSAPLQVTALSVAAGGQAK